ncbi:hypothetical protein CcCBS67573_g09996 [Chytriomyces confervae]|uniref:Enoyl reductase (ER) domain-containing protein n=1 Tax=Chytriomyces confervae TaxID=246404 RepID=A0A507DJF6_9FUNG|nr:hypothetical protein CcCBS67573_g09996 [Chytriomyces confervae]
MHQVVFRKANVISLDSSPDPQPTSGTVRIRVKAFGINFADIMMRTGNYGDAPPFPNVAGYEVSGVVDAVGENVSQDWIGARVAALTKFGGYSDVVVVPLDQLIRVPENLSFIDAASIPVVYLTAWMLLVHLGSIKKGEVLVIQNAGGGVGLAAIDIALHKGATTIGTSSAAKHAFLKSRGLHHAIDYRTQDFVTEIKRITNNKGADLIIDPIGGRESWNKNFASLRRGGRLGFFGASSMMETLKGQTGLIALVVAWIKVAFSMILGAPTWSPIKLMDENKAVFGVNLARMFEDKEPVVDWFKTIMDGVQEGWVRPHVDCVLEMANVEKAHFLLEERKTTGKIVIVVDAKDAAHDLSKYKFVQ